MLASCDNSVSSIDSDDFSIEGQLHSQSTSQTGIAGPNEEPDNTYLTDAFRLIEPIESKSMFKGEADKTLLDLLTVTVCTKSGGTCISTEKITSSSGSRERLR